MRIIEGDIFKSKAQTLVNTVNCVGVMGKGLSLQFRQRFPDMYEDYVRRCQAGQVRLGRPYLYRRPKSPWILNFPTKNHWRSVARLEDIVRGLEYLENHYREWGITSIAVPPLGSGEGQLEWRVVGPTLYRHLKRFDIPVELYVPFRTPHEELEPAFLEQKLLEIEGAALTPRSRIDPAWVAIVEALSKIEKERYHWPVGRIMFQKIVYFATEFGVSTGLEFKQGSFGPYSAQLKRRITQLVNNGLISEQQRGQMFEIKVGPTFQDARKAYREELEASRPIVDRLADLFVRLDTRQAEVAATVHFARERLADERGSRPTELDVLQEVMRWKLKRRPPLSESEVAVAIRSLSALRWLDAEPSQDLPLNEDVLLGA